MILPATTPPLTPVKPCDELPAEVDFTGGVRGQFFYPEERVSLPAERDADPGYEPPGADP